MVNAVRSAAAITDGPAEGGVIKTNGATFRFAAAGGAVSCSLDSAANYGPCTSAGSHSMSGLADGGHTFRVRVRDASNDEVVQSRTFTVDTSVPAPPPVAKPVINSLLTSSSKAYRKYTTFSQLVLTGVPGGANVSVTCKGKKCPVKSFSKTGGGNLKLKKFVKKKLRAGTKLTIRITKDGSTGKQFELTIRKAKKVRIVITQIG